MMVDAVAVSKTPAAPRPLSRTLHQLGLLLGVIGAVLGFLLDYFLGGLDFVDNNSNGSNIQILLAYSLSAVGFLAGMGFFKPPTSSFFFDNAAPLLRLAGMVR